VLHSRSETTIFEDVKHFLPIFQIFAQKNKKMLNYCQWAKINKSWH